MPKLVDHEEYRKELLAQAVEAFAQEGFSALSMKDLATRLGISPGSFYHYFANKEDLFLQMTAQLAQDLVRYLTEDVEADWSSEKKLAETFRRLEVREQDFQNFFLLIADFMRIAGIEKFRASGPYGLLFQQTHAALRDSMGLSERQIDFLLTYISGVIHNRTLSASAASLRAHQQMLASLIRSPTFEHLDTIAG